MNFELDPSLYPSGYCIVDEAISVSVERPVERPPFHEGLLLILQSQKLGQNSVTLERYLILQSQKLVLIQ